MPILRRWCVVGGICNNYYKDSMKKIMLSKGAMTRVVGASMLAFGLALPATAQVAAQETPPMSGQTPASSDANVVSGLPNITSRSDTRARVQPPPRGNQQNIPLPTDVKDVFADYAQTVTGVELPRFGRKLFTDVSSTFAPLDATQVNGDYVIGTGDEIQIRGWGMINVDVTATVDRDGAIYIPKVGAVRVAGVRYRDLQGHLKQAISKNFNNFELTASIAQTRAVQVYVVGHAARPGTYTLNAMSTLLNALFTAGGPDSTGTMRNIQLKRAGATVTTFDLYDMLVRGDKSHDATLRDGDVIYIPEVGPLAALTGDVKNPAIYELKGAASVADLIQWAGGVSSAADQRRIVVEKSLDYVYKPVADVLADDAATGVLRAIPVKSADVVRVFSPSAVGVPTRLQAQYVRVSGEVNQSGMFQLRRGETLRELMFRIGGVTDVGYLFATQVTRESVRRQQQQKLDEAADRFERDVESASSTRAAGSIDKDALQTIAADVERQRQIARRLRTVKAEGRIVLELENASAELKNLPDLALQDGDVITVPRKPGTVEVIGSVFQSNSFIYKPRRTVKDYVALAGGPTASADESEMYVIRADGTARSGRGSGWLSGVGGVVVNPGDTVIVPEKIERSSWRQSLKEWTAIFYQFGLGAAGLKVLKN